MEEGNINSGLENTNSIKNPDNLKVILVFFKIVARLYIYIIPIFLIIALISSNVDVSGLQFYFTVSPIVIPGGGLADAFFCLLYVLISIFCGILCLISVKKIENGNRNSLGVLKGLITLTTIVTIITWLYVIFPVFYIVSHDSF